MFDCHLQRRYLIDPCSTNINMQKTNFREIHAASGVIYDICFQGGDSRSTLDLQTSLSCSEFATCFQCLICKFVQLHHAFQQGVCLRTVW